MKKLFLVLLTVMSLHVFAQNDLLKVKSFNEMKGFVMMDKYDHVDINDQPMALIKIKTENIGAEEMKKFYFKGNLATEIDVKVTPNEIYLYVSADAATFIEILHPDYGKCKYVLPQSLKDFGGYEMVIVRE